ncbi:CLUMA_CG005926, isoform A [Clunio marinus]|uniref:Carboxylic ester hydrolase n=1 Tax=Clunio marinus TaxID=568069 RepID=A0A1J1HW99_9DIPT|nr:CLUMA_CG005926, isoform A [Clunio marinus]
MWKIIFLVVVIEVCVISCEEDPIVCIDNGCIRGKSFKGNQKAFEGFLGIPYAKPPTNELRLKDPQPTVEKWNDVYNATEEKMFCMQKNYFLPNPTVSGVEDCLYLYIYRPKNVMRNRRKLLPVIIYLHGGGFFAGTAGPSITGADFFMDTEDVIVVTMNYRLGPLGFLSTGDINMSGNFGLKDQALAIKWTKDNIKAFGGDASNIALMGQSAGASSAHLHMMSSPKWSRNLFHKTIMLSGNGNGPYFYVIENPLKQAKEFAKAIGIKDYDEMQSEELAINLRRVDPEILIRACDKLKIWSIDPLTISRPVVEDCQTHNGFLCNNPVEIWRSGDYVRVPMLTGFMDGDGGVRALAILENKTQLHDLNERFDELFPKLMEIENKSSEMNFKHLNMIKKRYFRGISEISNETSNDLIRIYTERSFITPLFNTLSQHVQQDKKTPAYLYKFSFNSSLSYSSFFTGNSKNYGAVHCDELIYLLKSPAIFPNQFEQNSIESKFRTKFVKFFTDFVANGKPNKISGKAVRQCEALNYKSTNPSLKCNIVEFGNDFTMKLTGEIDPTIAEFWNNIDPTMMGTKEDSLVSRNEVFQIFKIHSGHTN